MAQTRLKSGNLHMVGGENGSSGDVLKSKGDGTFEWGDAINPPTFSSVDYPGDDTAADPAGGQNLVINGTNFSSGITCTIGGTTPSSITLNSSTQMTVVSPAKAAGGYVLIINNTDGGSATVGNAITYNGIPAFSVAAGSLGSSKSGTFRVQLQSPNPKERFVHLECWICEIMPMTAVEHVIMRTLTELKSTIIIYNNIILCWVDLFMIISIKINI